MVTSPAHIRVYALPSTAEPTTSEMPLFASSKRVESPCSMRMLPEQSRMKVYLSAMPGMVNTG